MNTRALTGGIIVGVVILLAIYDIWVVIEPTPGDTISAVIARVALGNPIVPFAFGVLMGHWFWPMSSREKG